MKKLILSIAAISIAAFGFLYAVDKTERQEVMQSLGDELRAYAEENVHPQMQEWKDEIDSKISTEDLEKLNTLRADAEKFRDDMKDKRQEMRGMRGNGMRGNGMKGKNGKGNKGNKGNMGNNQNGECANMKNHKAQYTDELNSIIENYPEFFEELFAEVDETRAIWKDDMKEIRDNWFEENEDFLNENMKNGKRNKRMLENRMENRFSTPQHILLWNGVPVRKPSFRGDYNNSQRIETYNSPNPFSTSTTITYIIENAGNYKIEIINASGNVIETLHNGNLSEGENNFTFTANNLEPGVYFYKITGETIEQTNKMIISK